ncbi:sigma-70 family RNA polymerase sigma factor [Candidatus Margulisiibacteriota bacterium]
MLPKIIPLNTKHNLVQRLPTTTSNENKYKNLIKKHQAFVHYIARKFMHRGEPYEDLVQVGSIGLIKAAQRFQAAKNFKFITYAATIIIGEIKHYLRDSGHAIKIPRRIQDISIQVNKYINNMIEKGEPSPTVKGIAQALKISEEKVLESLELKNAYYPISLDSFVSEGQDSGNASNKRLINCISIEQDVFRKVVEMEDVKQAINMLTSRQQKVIQLRFFDNKQQAEIAKELGISQVHVSRVLTAGLHKIKDILKQGALVGKKYLIKKDPRHKITPLRNKTYKATGT